MSRTWYPIIDKDACIGCGACLDLCQHGVYKAQTQATCPDIVYPRGCVHGCRGVRDPLSRISHLLPRRRRLCRHRLLVRELQARAHLQEQTQGRLRVHPQLVPQPDRRGARQNARRRYVRKLLGRNRAQGLHQPRRAAPDD